METTTSFRLLGDDAARSDVRIVEVQHRITEGKTFTIHRGYDRSPGGCAAYRRGEGSKGDSTPLHVAYLRYDRNVLTTVLPLRVTCSVLLACLGRGVYDIHVAAWQSRTS